MNDFIKGQLTELAAQVAAGVKLVAEVSIKRGEFDEYAKYLHLSYPALFCYLEESECGWGTLWIMKDHRLTPLIDERPTTPSSPADHFYLGKLFGYSDAAILDFIDEECLKQEIRNKEELF